MRRAILAAVFPLARCAALVASQARAIGDRFDPAKYDKGGFAPATDAAATPTRVTALPLMRQRHAMARTLFSRSSVKTLINCDACHERAAAGSFALNEMVLPGATKMVRPGGSP